MDSRLKSLLECGAFLIGTALVVSALVGGSLGGGWARPGLDLTLDAQRSTVLDIEPAAKLTAHRTLRPSAEPTGVGLSLSARNATGGPVAVAVRTAMTSRGFDEMVHVRVLGQGHTLFSGALAGLRRGVAVGTLASHRTMKLRIEAWLPLGTHGYEAVTGRVPLTFDARSAAG